MQDRDPTSGILHKANIGAISSNWSATDPKRSMQYNVCVDNVILHFRRRTIVRPHKRKVRIVQKFEIYDEAGNYRYGKIKDNGKIELYDEEGKYFYGRLKSNGKIEIYDDKGKYSYGKLKPNGKIELYDDEGKYSYGKVKN